MSDIRMLDVEDIEFDKDNPRLPKSVRGSDDAGVLDYLATKTGIERLMTSIGENDYFLGEAIVVMEQEESGKYTVIEGNRRIAALRLLQEPTLVSSGRVSRAAEDAVHKPSRVPALIVNSREETLQYLGFRHISGVQRWDPLAKARYLEMLFEAADGDPEQRYISVAREIGSTSTAVRRHLDALATYDVIERKAFYDIGGLEEETFRFGTFYTAVSNVDIANFIGVRNDGSPTHPIEHAGCINQSRLEELVRWMFERDSQDNTTLGESRNIGKLGAVINDSDSLQALRDGQALDTAYRLTSHARDDFMRHMNHAIEELKQASANLYAVDADDNRARDSAREALKIIQWVSERMP